MAKRLTVQANREALYEFLRSSCTNGTLVPGSMLPAVRELSEQHGVTNHAVFQVIQRLTDEGFLYTVPRVGAFVGHPPQETIKPYLSVIPQYDTKIPDHYIVQAQQGFEDRIAQLGGHSITLSPEEAQFHLQQNDLLPLSGVFESLETIFYSSTLFEKTEVPSAVFGAREDIKTEADCVCFDDEAGAMLATRHLWQNGHRNIAFIAMHSEADVSLFTWSARREKGWQKTLEQMDKSVEGLAFHPSKTRSPHYEDQMQAGRDAAVLLMEHLDISAVVVVNHLAAEGMFDVFLESKWPVEKWPVVVCFDAAPGTGNSVVSYLRLPWEEIGREVAQVLWERHTGRLTGPPVQRLVPMRLIPRLSCRSDWAISSSVVQNHFFRSVAEPVRTNLR